MCGWPTLLLASPNASKPFANQNMFYKADSSQLNLSAIEEPHLFTFCSDSFGVQDQLAELLCAMSHVLTIVLEVLVFVLKGRQLLDDDDVACQLLDNLTRCRGRDLAVYIAGQKVHRIEMCMHNVGAPATMIMSQQQRQQLRKLSGPNSFCQNIRGWCSKMSCSTQSIIHVKGN